MLRGFIIILYKKGSSVASIETLDVDPCHQGKGIGLRLLHAGEYEMSSFGIKSMCLEVSTNNLSALHLYEKAGYKRASLLPYFYQNPHNGTRDAFRMVKKLT